MTDKTQATQPFFDGAAEGKLRLQICGGCETWAYPLTTRCANCGSSELQWQDTSGQGTVYSHAKLQRAYHPRHKQRLPLVLAQVDIPEGLRLMTNLIDVDPSTVRVGDAVVAAFETFDDGGVLPVFRKA